MFVTKRNHSQEPIHFDKITTRISRLIYPNEVSKINPTIIAQKVISSIYNGITTTELDLESAKICANLATTNPLYSSLAGRILVSNLHKNTSHLGSFVDKLNSYNLKYDLLEPRWLSFINKHKSAIEASINYELDYQYDYFGFKTLENAYLLKLNNEIFERPQDMLMRVASYIWIDDVDNTIKTYNLLANGYYTQATPTLFNAGFKRFQGSSCFLLSINDSTESIVKCWGDIAQISRYAGGIGLNVSNIRGKGQPIKSTNGKSSGLIKMLKVLNEIAREFDQSGKRPGSIAVYLEPHHPEIFQFLDLKKNTGAETERCRDLFPALWVSDLFMKAVETDGDWWLLSSDVCPRLNDVYGEEFERLYKQYVSDGKYVEITKARKVMKAILDSQIETGTPYISYKDNINRKSNQQNIGVVKSSNLCVAPETLILTDKGYIEISTLQDQSVNVWNGEEFSEVIVRKTGENQELLKINFSNGLSIECTPYHKFYIKTENKRSLQNNSSIKIVEAKDLRQGMQLIETKYPIINDDTLLDKLSWLETLCDNNGTIVDDELQITSMDYDFCKHLILFLHTLGVNGSINTNDTKSYRVMINSTDLYNLTQIGFNPKGFVENKNKTKRFVLVDTIQYTGRIDNTFCFTEHKRNTGIFNGIITSNCNEIVLHSSTEETACCNLASIAINKFTIPFNPTNKFTIYTKDKCKFCEYTKKYLQNHNYEYIEQPKLTEDVLQFLRQSGKLVSYPQIYYGEVYIGGFEDLLKFTKSNFDFKKLKEVAYHITRCLNNVIDYNFYPTPETRLSNIRHRPIGVGIQGLSDALVMMGIYFDSEEAVEFNRYMMETIYYGCMKSSLDIAIEREQLWEQFPKYNYIDLPEYYDINFKNDDVRFTELYHRLKYNLTDYRIQGFKGAYSTFKNSPLHRGKFQFDMWRDEGHEVKTLLKWDELMKQIQLHGVRNSMLTALMPTASTSQILGNNECFEWFTNNIYTRRTLSGDFILVNKYMMNDLISIGIWDNKVKESIIDNDGSIQHLQLPQMMKKMYKTIWEIPQVWVMKQAKARAPFVCQTQSMNLFMGVPDYQKLNSAHIWSWKNGLKTGMYYLRSRPVKATTKIAAVKEEGCLNCSA
jgi:ribonucleotide reductase alpha subunit